MPQTLTDAEFDSTVLDHLRELSEGSPEDGCQTTREIASWLEVPCKALYDHQRDAGPLFRLMQAGKVHRYGPTPGASEPDRWVWAAAGGRLVWGS